MNFSDKQRLWEGQQLSKFETQMALDEEADAAFEVAVTRHMAALYELKGSELAAMCPTISYSIEAYAEELADKEFDKEGFTEPDDPEDDITLYDFDNFGLSIKQF